MFRGCFSNGIGIKDNRTAASTMTRAAFNHVHQMANLSLSLSIFLSFSRSPTPPPVPALQLQLRSIFPLRIKLSVNEIMMKGIPQPAVLRCCNEGSSNRPSMSARKGLPKYLHNSNGELLPRSKNSARAPSNDLTLCVIKLLISKRD